MKKLLSTLAGMVISLGAFSQGTYNADPSLKFEDSGIFLDESKVQSALQAKKPVNDTILPFIGSCANPVSFLAFNDGTILTSTLNLGSDGVISDIGQFLNSAGNDVDVYSLLVIIVEKEEGPSKGSFTAAVYDTTGGVGTTPLATSAAVTFDNINDTTSATIINEFTFASPFNIKAPFWGTVSVDNGSDTLSLASTPNGCGANAIFNLNDTAWFAFQGSFTGVNGISAHIWATVQNNNVGLDKSLISRSGLSFYPNPARDKAIVEFDMPNESNVTLVIQDMSGREVYRTAQTFNAGNREFELDLSSFTAGPYTYQVVGEKTQLNGVFVKE